MKVKEVVFIVEEDPEDGYNARAMGVSIFAEGGTLEELKENIKGALRCHFDEEKNIPAYIRLHIIREETLEYA